MYRLTHVQHFTCTLWQLLYVFIHLTLTSKTILCVCWQCCLSESDSTVELCCYRLRRFTCSAAGRLKDKGRGGWRRGEGAGGLPIIWCCLSCIIPRFQMEGNCWWSRRAEQLKTERERERGGEEKEERPALFFGVSMQTPDKASLPLFTKFVFFPGSRFDRLSILMESCDAPKLCLNPSRNSQQLRPLLICNFCRAPVEKPKGYE